MRILPLLLFMLPAILFADLERIEPRVCAAFGRVSVVECEFVEKGNDYWSQNFVKEDYYLKVLSVDGVALDEPVVVEYVRDFKGEVTPGVRYAFKAFESIYTFGEPQGWGELSSQVNYRVVSVLVIKPDDEVDDRLPDKLIEADRQSLEQNGK